MQISLKGVLGVLFLITLLLIVAINQIADPITIQSPDWMRELEEQIIADTDHMIPLSERITIYEYDEYWETFNSWLTESLEESHILVNNSINLEPLSKLSMDLRDMMTPPDGDIRKLAVQNEWERYFLEAGIDLDLILERIYDHDEASYLDGVKLHFINLACRRFLQYSATDVKGNEDIVIQEYVANSWLKVQITLEELKAWISIKRSFKPTLFSTN